LFGFFAHNLIGQECYIFTFQDFYDCCRTSTCFFFSSLPSQVCHVQHNTL
jgi:hypothetical protein